ncbi:MAG: GTPase Era [Bryobacterales bacterium]|nr:GTPase Era [Bryobacterales bacterium]
MSGISFPSHDTGFRSGYVSIIGRPNAGKSTLLNALVGQKLAIVADKPQTTRTSVQGILHLPGAQVIFMDTPGIHKSDTLFNKRMMDIVRAALKDQDLILYLVDATLPFDEAELQALDAVRKSETPTILLVNKIDRLERKTALLPLLEAYGAAMEFAEVIPISALTGDGLEDLRKAIVSRLPEGPALYPKDQVTDQPERFLAAELIRESVLDLTSQEVPHSVAVVVEQWEEKRDLNRISATIYVERAGQKGILIGAKGAMLKRIGSQARSQIEAMLDKRVFLELFVKVRPKWRENPQFLNEIDWRSMAGGGDE